MSLHDPGQGAAMQEVPMPKEVPQIPPHISVLKPYIPGRAEEEIELKYGVKNVVKLASNENPFGPSPKAIQVMGSHLSRVHRYPVSDGWELREAIAAGLDLSEDNVVLGSGLIFALIFAIGKFCLGFPRHGWIATIIAVVCGTAIYLNLDKAERVAGENA